MDLQTIQKGKLTIALDKDFLARSRTEMLELFDNMDEEEAERTTNKKNKVITRENFEEALNRLYNLALDIIDEKLGIDIFEYLFYTKAGLFHKTSSTLLATSGIKDVWNGDYFQIKFMDLILTPVSYLDKINPFVALQKNGSIWGNISGEGNIAYIELCWNARKAKEIPLFDGNINPSKVEKVRNSYLKLEKIKPGYTYFDANGNEFLYAGQFYLDNNNWYKAESNKIFRTKNDYLNSASRKYVLEHREEVNKYVKYPGTFLFLKMTKGNEKIIQKSKNVDELLHYFVKEYFWNWHSKWKTLDNPLKVVSEGKKVIEPDVENGFYCEKDKPLEYEDWFYFEKIG